MNSNYLGITFNGKHSSRDIGITMTGSRSIGYPRKRKRKITPPYSNIAHDFSELYGDQVYDERPISYRFNIIDFNRLTTASVDHLATVVVNWLMNSKGKQKLIDPYIPNYHFMAEVEGDLNLEMFHSHGILDVTFIAYPFKINDLPEGNNLWKTFNFDLDVLQETKFKTIRPSSFVELSTGGFATIGSWATTYASSGGRIPIENIGISRRILRRENVQSSISSRAYELEGISGLVVEQDIIQAYRPEDTLEVTLINPGTPSVAPNVRTETKVSIVKDNMIYNFANTQNPLFRLDSGENRLKIYSIIERDISFEFHKELI